jgi:hypothetical protein
LQYNCILRLLGVRDGRADLNFARIVHSCRVFAVWRQDRAPAYPRKSEARLAARAALIADLKRLLEPQEEEATNGV